MTTTEEVQDRIINLLLCTAREGMGSMLVWLKCEGFFTSPASTRFHGCYEGGLAAHSLNVYELLERANEDYDLAIPVDSVTITAVLHDVCKVGAYVPTSPGSKQKYRWNKSQPPGHALLSLLRIVKHIKLTELEEKMIMYHMGVYGLNEFDPQSGKGEYSLRGGGLANAWYHFPAVKVMYFCDELATLGERSEEGL